MKSTAKILSDEIGRPTQITIKDTRITINYDEKGNIYSVDFSKAPPFPELVSTILGLTKQVIPIKRPSSQLADSTAIAVAANTEVTVLKFEGEGTIRTMFIKYVKSAGAPVEDDFRFILEIDNFRQEYNIAWLTDLVKETENTPTLITFTEIDDTNLAYVFIFNIPLNYKKNFKLIAKNAGAGTMAIRLLYFMDS